MSLPNILLLVVYACLTLTLIVLKIFRVGNRRRGVVKMITSLCFLAAAIWGCVNCNGGLHIALAVALMFAFLGNLFLVFMDKHLFFVLGVSSFSVAAFVLSAYSIVNYTWVWWSAILFVLLETVNILAQKFKVLDYGKNKVVLNIYTVLISACGSLGLTLLCQGVAVLPMFLFGLGCFLYFASDVCLGMYIFRFRNSCVDAVNSLLYFPSMLLIALSLLL